MCIFAVVDSTCFRWLFETEICSALKAVIAGMEIDNFFTLTYIIVVLILFL